MPEVSVVIPLYNHEDFIAEAVESVLGQTVADLEVIVVDDGSTDGSCEVLSGYRDPRLRVIRQDNQGAHAAINRGLKEATGRFLALLNSDDAYHPQRVEKALAALEGDPRVGLVSSYIEIVDDRSQRLGVKHGYQDCEPWVLEKPERSFRSGENLRAALLAENYLATTSNYTFTSGWYARVGEFRPLRYTHDWDFALRIARVARIVLLPEPLIRYRVHEKNTIRENQAAMAFEICWCLAVHLPQHLADEEFMRDFAEDEAVDLLLHSLYTFGLEEVLNAMLLQRLDAHPDKAVRMLHPEDEVRAQYMEFINRRFAEQDTAHASEEARDRLRDRFYTLKAGFRKALLHRKANAR